MTKYLDLQKMYDEGIESLYMGGEIENGSYYREKDVLEEDYSDPLLTGIVKIDAEDKMSGTDLHFVRCGDVVVALNEEEYKTGVVAK